MNIFYVLILLFGSQAEKITAKVALDPDHWNEVTTGDVALKNACQVRTLYDTRMVVAALVNIEKDYDIAYENWQASSNPKNKEYWALYVTELQSRMDALHALHRGIVGGVCVQDWSDLLVYRKACLKRGMNPTAMLWRVN